MNVTKGGSANFIKDNVLITAAHNTTDMTMGKKRMIFMFFRLLVQVKNHLERSK